MKKKFFNDRFFECLDSNSLYVLGFFAADGSLSITKRGGYYFSIQSKDKQIIMDIRCVMKSNHKVSKRIDKRTEGSFYRLQVGSKRLCKDLIRLGFGSRKSENLPNIELCKKDFKIFLRGYFDGDGNIWSGVIHKKRKRQHINLLLSFTSSSKDFLFFLKSRLARFIKTQGSLFAGQGNYYRLQYSKNDTLKIYDFMYNTNTPFPVLLRKKRMFEKAIKSMQP